MSSRRFVSTTPGFTLVNLSGDWKPCAERDLRLTLSVANLLDAKARRHASFLTVYTPLAGCDVRVGLSALLKRWPMPGRSSCCSHR